MTIMIVYLVTNLINGKQYIGQTIRKLTVRWQAHQHTSNSRYLFNAIKKYGVTNFKIEQIASAKNREDLDRLEAAYIKKYKTLVPHGYNIRQGGNGARQHEETKLKIGKAHLGKIRKGKTKKGAHWRDRAVIKTDCITGLEKEYCSAAEAARDGFLACAITECCKGRVKTHKKNYWRYKDSPKPEFKPYKREKGLKALNLKTNEILYFTSFSEAGKNGFTPSAIFHCCNGKTKQHKGYCWSYWEPNV